MYNQKERHWNGVTISLPDRILDKLDILRHDVSRSKYLQRVLEDHFRLVDIE